jgi:hypothetical protein
MPGKMEQASNLLPGPAHRLKSNSNPLSLTSELSNVPLSTLSEGAQKENQRY